MAQPMGDPARPGIRRVGRVRSDGELLGATAHVADAFDEFYRRHYRPVLAYLSKRTGDTYTALDLTAEVFAAAYLGRASFRSELAPARAWLFGIANNKVADLRRRGQRDLAARRQLGIARRAYTDAALEDAEALIDATQLLDGLPVLERDAVMARVVEDLSYQEIASRANVSPATIRKRVSTGLAKLAKGVRR